MKGVKHICLVILFCLISYSAYPQADSLKINTLRLTGSYLGLGFGACKSGIGGVISGTFILSNNWGASIRYNPNSFLAENMPDDYIDLVLFMPFLTNGIPSDNVTALSVNIIKEFPTKTRFVRFGIEFGPAFVKYELARFTPVPNWIPLLGSNYDVSHDTDNCIGFSMRGKAEFPLTRFAGLEAAPYVNINRFRNFFGIDFCLTLGLLRGR